jgi:hypothetical protein
MRPTQIGAPRQIRVPLSCRADLAGEHPAAIVASLRGHHEAELTDLRSGTADARGGETCPPVDLETTLLLRAIVDIDGRTPDRDAVCALTIGDRNRALLAALAATYGMPDSLVARCPDAACGAAVDLPLDFAFFIAARSAYAANEEHRIVVAADSRQIGVRFRLPNGHDLAASVIEAQDDPSMAARHLLQRCVLATDDAESAAIEHYRDAIALAVEGAMETLEPMAEITLRSSCPECGGPVAGTLDPVRLIAAAMDRHGGIFLEIDRLARAYHWSESDILALPAMRRRHYLALIETSDAAPTRERVRL